MSIFCRQRARTCQICRAHARIKVICNALQNSLQENNTDRLLMAGCMRFPGQLHCLGAVHKVHILIDWFRASSSESWRARLGQKRTLEVHPPVTASGCLGQPLLVKAKCQAPDDCTRS